MESSPGRGFGRLPASRAWGLAAAGDAEALGAETGGGADVGADVDAAGSLVRSAALGPPLGAALAPGIDDVRSIVVALPLLLGAPCALRPGSASRVKPAKNASIASAHTTPMSRKALRRGGAAGAGGDSVPARVLLLGRTGGALDDGVGRGAAGGVCAAEGRGAAGGVDDTEGRGAAGGVDIDDGIGFLLICS